MLERTAGCLESGSLRRLLPASRKSLKSCRTLHSGFWTHGGGDIELSPFWAALVEAATPQQPDESSAARTMSGHTGMLLDFLYPAGTLNFLRQYSIWGFDRQDGRWRHGVARIGQRQYTSSAKDSISKSDTSTVAEVETKDGNVLEYDSNIDLLYRKMKLTTSYDFAEAWRQYELLPPDDQNSLRPQLMIYLSMSDRTIDAERVTELFEILGEGQRTSNVYRSVVRAFLKLRNLADAMRLYEMALEKLVVPAGAEEILAHLMENGSWARALSLWEDVAKLELRGNWSIFEVVDLHPNLSSQAFELAREVDRRIKTNSSSSETASRLQNFAAEVIRRTLLATTNFSPSRFGSLLQTLRNWKLDTPSVYEQAVEMLLDLNQTRLAVKCYRNARKGDVRFTRETLHIVLRVCCDHHSVLGMKQVLDDFFRFYERPSAFAYKLCMKEFAAKGDTRTVHALWQQYISRFTPDRPELVMTGADFAPILSLHAKRGELQEALKWFDKMQTGYGLRPETICWNILLNAYGKVHDYEGAYSCFENLLNDRTCQPTHYTIGTMMGICTQQGDIDRTIELYTLAESLGIEKSVAMLDTLVLAHVQDDDLEHAEKICVEALTMRFKETKPRTRMWNYLLVAHSQRRDLNTVYRVLQRMSEAGIEYDGYTYSALMQALCMVKQPDRAYQILQDVMPDAGVTATNFHYAVVMGGYIGNGETKKAFNVQNRMFSRGLRGSASTRLIAIRARLAEDEKLLQQGTPEEVMQGAMQMFREVMKSMDTEDIVANPKKGAARYPMDVAYPTMFYSYVMHILASNSDTEAVDQLYAEFMSILPESRQEHSPLSVMAALMFAKLRANDHEAVESCWLLSLAQAKERGQPLPPISTGTYSDDTDPPLSPHKIVPVHQLDLCKHLYLYLESLSLQNKVEDMIKTVDAVLQDGFALDNRTWNHYIQLLAQKYKYKLAFKLCEERLMNNWTGWQQIRWKLPGRNRLPYDLRNLRKQIRHLRPLHISLLYLARSLLDLQAMSAESRTNELILEDIRDSCPKTMKAIETMPRTDDALERHILREW
ncbi:related to coxI translation protein CYA5 [Phialocephala subalpina]|uniref:Related to coxI translation protein CYA5 n=1 Tax=Phialocephala subalpina TaxID=576137 RepID=A0A1L7XBJ2_9HELO|nr:related to coxI translation protein CYA5 [Phialocephala subalpina]